VEDESRGGVEARHGWSAKESWSTGRLLPPFLFSPPLSPSLAQPPHGMATRPPYLAGWPPLGSPIKGLPRGAFSFIPQAHKKPQIF
jgi:hypothetical protein